VANNNVNSYIPDLNSLVPMGKKKELVQYSFITKNKGGGGREKKEGKKKERPHYA